MSSLTYGFLKRLLQTAENDESYRVLAAIFGKMMLQNSAFRAKLRNDDLLKTFLDFNFESKDELECLFEVVKHYSDVVGESEQIREKMLTHIENQSVKDLGLLAAGVLYHMMRDITFTGQILDRLAPRADQEFIKWIRLGFRTFTWIYKIRRFRVKLQSTLVAEEQQIPRKFA